VQTCALPILSKLLATRDLGLFGYCCFIFSLFVLIFLFIVVSSAFLKLITFALEFVKFTFCLLVFSPVLLRSLVLMLLFIETLGFSAVVFSFLLLFLTILFFFFYFFVMFYGLCFFFFVIVCLYIIFFII